MEVAFFRNVQNYDQLRYKTDSYRGIVAEYREIDTIDLAEKDYQSFCKNLMKNYDFLLPYIEKAIISNDIWHGVLVKFGDEGIVVVMNGYQYPRYVALKK